MARGVILVLIVAVGAALYGFARGGSLDGLANTRFRYVWVLFLGLVIQAGFGMWDPAWLTDTGALVIVLVSNAAVALFLAINRHVPGMLIAAFGLLLNVAVIAPNGAMPVSLTAAELAGGDAPAEFGLKHEILTNDTVFPWLADVIPVPGMRSLLSVGDVVLAAGIGFLVYRRMVDEPDESEYTEEADEAEGTKPAEAFD